MNLLPTVLGLTLFYARHTQRDDIHERNAKGTFLPRCTDACSQSKERKKKHTAEKLHSLPRYRTTDVGKPATEQEPHCDLWRPLKAKTTPKPTNTSGSTYVVEFPTQAQPESTFPRQVSGTTGKHHQPVLQLPPLNAWLGSGTMFLVAIHHRVNRHETGRLLFVPKFHSPSHAERHPTRAARIPGKKSRQGRKHFHHPGGESEGCKSKKKESVWKW